MSHPDRVTAKLIEHIVTHRYETLTPERRRGDVNLCTRFTRCRPRRIAGTAGVAIDRPLTQLGTVERLSHLGNWPASSGHHRRLHQRLSNP